MSNDANWRTEVADDGYYAACYANGGLVWRSPTTPCAAKADLWRIRAACYGEHKYYESCTWCQDVGLGACMEELTDGTQDR